MSMNANLFAPIQGNEGALSLSLFFYFPDFSRNTLWFLEGDFSFTERK